MPKKKRIKGRPKDCENIPKEKACFKKQRNKNGNNNCKNCDFANI